MSWYDGIGTGLGHLMNMWSGAPAGNPAPAAKPPVAPVGPGAHDFDFGKATGLEPFMKMLGIGSHAEPAPEERMATPREMADARAGHLPVAGGPTSYSNAVTGQQETKWQNYFGTTVRDADGKPVTNPDGTTKTQGGFNLPSYQNWDAAGRSYGNRQSDIDARDESKTDKQIKVAAPEIYQPDLSKIPRKVEGQTTDTVGAGHFAEHAYGSHLDWDDGTGWSGKTKVDPGTGKGSTSIYSTGYQAGVEEKEGYRAVAFNSDKRYSASAEAGMVANAGLSGSIGLDTEKGLYATGGIGAKSGLYAQADADAKSHSVKIGGQDYDAGIGVHGDTFLGAKAGASGTLGIGPEFIGAKGNIGAFVGGEAAGDIHGNLGPLGGKLGASGMVGAGIGADGDISYKDGKFHIGGKLFACLGYGGSLSGDLTVDFGKIAKTLGPVGSGIMDIAGGQIMGAANVIGGGIGGAIDVGQGLYRGIGDVAGGIGEGIGDVASGIGNGFSNFAEGDVLSGLGDIGGGLAHGVGDVASGVGHGIYDVGAGLVSGVGSVAGGIANGASAVAGGIGSAIGGVLSW